jgi:valyl-tRNA synthetase
LEQELKKLEQELERVTNKLSNPNFLKRAPEEIVSKEKALHRELTEGRSKLLGHLEMVRSLSK